jgi:hypothetical protein
VEGTPLDGVDGVGDFAHTRNHDDRERRLAPLDAVEELQPVHALHADVADDDIEVSSGKEV